jgi:peptide/nickel transport system permease protein
MLIFLSLLFLFAPLLAPYDDNLQFNLPQAKRLAPLSTRHLVEKYNHLYENKKLGLFREYENMLFRNYVSSDYYITDKPIKSISREIKTKEITFVLGTDEYGRDILSRIIYATRYSLMISLLAILISGILGVLLGFVSGYYGGFTDLILNRIVEMFLAIPFVFLVILSVAFLGDSLGTVILVLGLAGWMSLFKVVRGEVLKLKTKDHIITAKMIGMSLPSLLTKEYFPLLFPSVSVNLIFQFAFILVAESSLSFLGVTGNYSHPSLGGMMQQGFEGLYNAWWISIFPTLVITWIFFIVQNVVRKMSGAKSNIFH